MKNKKKHTIYSISNVCHCVSFKSQFCTRQFIFVLKATNDKWKEDIDENLYVEKIIFDIIFLYSFIENGVAKTITKFSSVH